MAKNKNTKVVQMLSPEKYIKRKARTLPIYECWINKGWEKDKLASITLSRKHTNGNLTFGLYLVDLNCLGIKNALYRFNISKLEYKDLINQQEDNMELEKISYTLAHNIVFAGLEFAADYNFKPHKDFAIARYILEEDNDDIELIEIECGKNNKPYYIQGLLDDDLRAEKIIAHLEKHAGVGNFKYLLASGDYFDEEFEEHEIDKFYGVHTEDKLILFTEYLENIANLSDEDKEDLSMLTSSIIDDFLDKNKTNHLYTHILNEIEKYEITDEVTNEFIFGKYTPEYDPSEIKKEFTTLYSQLSSDTKKAGTKIKKLQRKYPGSPGLHFLILYTFINGNPRKYNEKVMLYAEKFPEYSLLKLMKHISLLTSNDHISKEFDFESAMDYFFNGRTKIHFIEMFNFLITLVIRAMKSDNIDEITVLESIANDFNMFSTEDQRLEDFISMAKLKFILQKIEDMDQA